MLTTDITGKRAMCVTYYIWYPDQDHELEYGLCTCQQWFNNTPKGCIAISDCVWIVPGTVDAASE